MLIIVYIIIFFSISPTCQEKNIWSSNDDEKLLAFGLDAYPYVANGRYDLNRFY
jgi:hypothetical protein